MKPKVQEIVMGARSFEITRQGYNTVQVEEFLAEAREDLYTLEAENHKLRETAQGFQEDMERYREREYAIGQALVMAHKNAEDIVNDAKQKAACLLTEAQSGLQAQVDTLRQEAGLLESQVDALRQEYRAVQEKHAAALGEHIRIFESVLTSLKTEQDAYLSEAQALPEPEIPMPEDAFSPAGDSPLDHDFETQAA
ncbi:MAG: DivIVA domain-containing protein [Armatimonadetes bacterium]|nr:DivIVA domain-containing protein [Armatimonadota bacterium]